MKYFLFCFLTLFFLSPYRIVICATANAALTNPILTNQNLTNLGPTSSSLKNLQQNNIQVTDYTGVQITRNKPTKRVIALAPHIVENIFSVGLGHQLVGVVSHSDYPEEAKEIPIVGHYNGYSLEKIVALKPDIVFIWASSNKHNIAEKLRALGIDVYIDDPHRLQDINKSLNDIAVLGGIDINTLNNVTLFNQKIKALNNAHKQNIKKDIKEKSINQNTTLNVFFQISDNPLQTLSGNHIVSDIITLCGGVNIYAEETVIAPLVSRESILLRNPDIIMTGSDGDKIQTIENNTMLNTWNTYTTLHAVKNQAFVYIPADWIYRHTLRIADAAELMCQSMDALRKKHI